MRVYIDTDELASMAHETRDASVALSDINLALTRRWAHSLPPPPELIVLGARCAGVQARIVVLAGRLQGDGVQLDVDALRALVSQAGGTASLASFLNAESTLPAAKLLLELLKDGDPSDELLGVLGASGLLAKRYAELAELTGDGAGMVSDALEFGKTLTSGVLPKTPLGRFVPVAGIALGVWQFQQDYARTQQRDHPDRPMFWEDYSESLHLVGGGITTVGLGVGLVAPPVGAFIGLTGLGVETIGWGIDGVFWLKEEGPEVWADARAGWVETAARSGGGGW